MDFLGVLEDKCKVEAVQVGIRCPAPDGGNSLMEAASCRQPDHPGRGYGTCHVDHHGTGRITRGRPGAPGLAGTLRLRIIVRAAGNLTRIPVRCHGSLRRCRIARANPLQRQDFWPAGRGLPPENGSRSDGKDSKE
jgi:hypothetical protein